MVEKYQKCFFFFFYTTPWRFYPFRNCHVELRRNTVVHSAQQPQVRTKRSRQWSLCEQLCTPCMLTTKAAWRPRDATWSSTHKNTLISLHTWFLDWLSASSSGTFSVIVATKLFMTLNSSVQVCVGLEEGLRSYSLWPCVSYCLSST